MSGRAVPCAPRTTHIAPASGAGAVGANAPVAADLVKNDAVPELANIVASHAVGMGAPQLSDSATVQIVDEVAVVKCNGGARSSVDVAYHFPLTLDNNNRTREDRRIEDDYFAGTHQKIELRLSRGAVSWVKYSAEFRESSSFSAAICFP